MPINFINQQGPGSAARTRFASAASYLVSSPDPTLEEGKGSGEFGHNPWARERNLSAPMAQQRENYKPIGFKTVQLLKDQTLGIGSYGKVCKAKCDDLLCAAKLIHETLFDPTAQQLIAPQREHRLPMRRFEQECEFLSTIRHPNIVQYLGIYRDPDTGLPALLMELMDDSLTHFLESSPQLIPYHIQVNVCHDVTLALSFLHSNGIIHRDLSSNNVLLCGNVLAKVTDFGMARLGNQNPRATQLTFTMCPGTDVYMPPEAILDKPVYTEKIDCFSFGVIIIQTITREFPKPGDRRKRIRINQPGLPRIVEVPISEIERRQNHISEIDPNHTLLQVALDCLKDEDIERPSAQQLCERVAALKEHPQYRENVEAVETRSTAEQDRSDERDRELRSLRQQHSRQVQDLQQIIQSQSNLLAQKDQTIAQKEQALREKDETIAEKLVEINQLGRQLGRVNKQLRESEQRRIVELEQLRSATDAAPRSQEQSSSRASIKLTWREGRRAVPQCKQSDPYTVGVVGNTLYIRTWSQEIFGYTILSSSWSRLPNSPISDCPSVIINNLLTLIGGSHDGTITNQLFSLTGEGSDRRWTEEFPPMQTERWKSIALSTETALIVAGGRAKDRSSLNTTEVMNIATKQWSTAADLPQSVVRAPAAVCGDQVYILGKPSMYTCSVTILTQPQSLNIVGVWSKVATPPVTQTTCVSIHDRLLAIGGKDSDKEPSTAIHMYSPTTDSWEVISHMRTPRRLCIAAVLPNNN